MTKRLAVCFSGQPRISYTALTYFVNNVTVPFTVEGYKVDCFVHFWNTITPSGTIEKRRKKYPEYVGSPLDNPSDYKKLPAALTYFMEQCNPVLHRFERELTKENLVLENFCHTERNTAYNYNSQYHSVKKSHDLCRAYEIENNFRYDYVIRARPDLSILTPLKLEECSKNYICVPNNPGHQPSMSKTELTAALQNEEYLKQLEEGADKLNVSKSEFIKRMLLDHTFDEAKICNDQFIISSSDNMYKISRLIDYMEKEINGSSSQITQEMHSPAGIGLERMLWIYIQTFSKIKKLDLKTRIEGSIP
tara:strand:- start:450 stop:1367 length:918 start_codon:yes stop_codon:yes gene_type:complete